MKMVRETILSLLFGFGKDFTVEHIRRKFHFRSSEANGEFRKERLSFLNLKTHLSRRAENKSYPLIDGERKKVGQQGYQ